MSSVLYKRVCSLFAPPRYLAFPFSGIDLSTSSVKAVRLVESPNGLILAKYAEERLLPGACSDGEIIDYDAVAEKITIVAKATGISSANIAVVESPTFLAESIDRILMVCDRASIEVRAIEEETVAMARALLSWGDESTTLLVDIGRTTTKVAIVTKRIPIFSTTIGIGGHAFTLAVQKYFGVTEEEARKIKVERGITRAQGNKEYLVAMLSIASAIRDEISHCLNYWQEKSFKERSSEPVSRVILFGGNASIKGLPEYFEEAFKIPVISGDVFTNFASRDMWIPSLDYTESLSYATAIGLALYDQLK
jgi:Tfp pilus assembly PilM family ATPase